MYRNTRFGELLKGLSRKLLDKAVSSHQSDKYTKSFSSRDHLLAMIYGHVSGCTSLRELEAGFNCQTAHHYHLGSGEIKRSTLSDANNQRSCDVFAEVCSAMLSQAQRTLRNELKDLLYLLDSTPIPLKGLGFDEWASQERDNRLQGVKLHMMLASQANTPVSATVTDAKVSDLKVGREIALEKGATYVFDRVYTDYNWWFRIHKAQSYFVARFKRNASLELINCNPIDQEAFPEIIEDAVVSFKNKQPRGKCINQYYGTELRRITVARPDKETPLIIATNDFKRSAKEIADLYRQRWGIELFFKWMKQHLKIKKFLGRSKNAVKIQLYAAIITYLLVKQYHKKSSSLQSLKIFLIELRSTLFQRIETELILDRKRRWQAREFFDIQGVLAL